MNYVISQHNLPFYLLTQNGCVTLKFMRI